MCRFPWCRDSYLQLRCSNKTGNLLVEVYEFLNYGNTRQRFFGLLFENLLLDLFHELSLVLIVVLLLRFILLPDTASISFGLVCADAQVRGVKHRPIWN
jgi:hypothetical protein